MPPPATDATASLAARSASKAAAAAAAAAAARPRSPWRVRQLARTSQPAAPVAVRPEKRICCVRRSAFRIAPWQQRGRACFSTSPPQRQVHVEMIGGGTVILAGSTFHCGNEIKLDSTVSTVPPSRVISAEGMNRVVGELVNQATSARPGLRGTLIFADFDGRGSTQATRIRGGIASLRSLIWSPRLSSKKGVSSGQRTRTTL